MNKVIIFIAVLIFINSVASFLLTPAVLALLIPIIAIVSFSPIGRAIAASITGKNVNTYSLFSFAKDSRNDVQELKEKCEYLEKRIKEYDEEFDKMREAIIFYDSKKISVKNETEEKFDTKKIDLTKHKKNQ